MATHHIFLSIPAHSSMTTTEKGEILVDRSMGPQSWASRRRRERGLHRARGSNPEDPASGLCCKRISGSASRRSTYDGFEQMERGYCRQAPRSCLGPVTTIRTTSHSRDIEQDLGQTMELLVHTTPPTAWALTTLPSLEDDNKIAGVYLCILWPLDPELHVQLYVGSGTGPVGMVAMPAKVPLGGRRPWVLSVAR